MVGSIRLLIVLIVTAMLSFAVRFGDVVVQVKTSHQAMTASLNAEEKPKEEPKESGSKHEGGEKGKEGAKDKKASVPVPEGLPETEPAPLPQKDWADPTTADLQFSETQHAVLEELKKRRGELDERENKMNQRQALLEVTEKRIEEKIAELDQIRNEIKELLGKQSEEEEARLTSLVKIYEGMKPKEAAEIFNNLDMDILLEVVSRMSERKVAPVVAAMSTEKAQELTTKLAEQKKLPELPE